MRTTIQAPEGLLRDLRRVFGRVPWITRVSAFGSRAKGIARPDSDLDLAIEIEWQPGMGVGGDVFSLWTAYEPELVDQLAGVSDIVLDLQLYVSDEETPNIHGALQHSIVVYEKTRDTP